MALGNFIYPFRGRKQEESEKENKKGQLIDKGTSYRHQRVGTKPF